MGLDEAFECIAEAIPGDLKRFQRHIDPVWSDEALEATGTATVRRRRLPADQVVWMVRGMALLRDDAIERVVDCLDLALPGRDGLVAKSAIAQARQRLGDEPIGVSVRSDGGCMGRQERRSTSLERSGLVRRGWDHVAAGRHSRESGGVRRSECGRGERRKRVSAGPDPWRDGLAVSPAVRPALRRLSGRVRSPWPRSCGASFLTTR